MAAVVVVENDLKDSVREFGLIVDASRQNTEFSDSLKPYIGDDVTNKKELATLIQNVSTKEFLSSLSNRDFEPTFYLLVHLISELESVSLETLLLKDSNIVSLLQACTPAEQPSVRDRKSLRTTTILSTFNTFFNLLPTSSKTRVHLIKTMLDIVSESQLNFALIQTSIGDHLVDWLRAANASEAEIRQLFWSFISLDKDYSLHSLQLIKKFSAEFALPLNELQQLITFALSSAIVDVSFLVNNNVASALSQFSSDDLVKTFVQYTQGSIISSVSAPLPQEVLYKSKILAMAKFFTENRNERASAFHYKDIPSELVSSSTEFEQLLIDAIKAGVVEGKLNQVDETFFLVRVNAFILAGDNQKLAQDWEAVKSTLLNWKQSLDNINEIVMNAKENIVNNNNAN